MGVQDRSCGRQGISGTQGQIGLENHLQDLGLHTEDHASIEGIHGGATETTRSGTETWKIKGSENGWEKKENGSSQEH